MPSDSRDYNVELSGAAGGGDSPAPAPGRSRPFLNVKFECCGAYARVYRSADKSAYRGHCPRCAKPVTFRVGPGGTDERFFVVR